MAAAAAVITGFTPIGGAVADLAIAEGEPIVRPGSGFGGTAPEVRMPPDATGSMPVDPNEGAAKKQIAELDQRYALTPPQRARADFILQNDPYRKTMFGSRKYAVDQVGSWLDDETGKMLGAIYDITLDSPVSTGLTRFPVLVDGQRQTFQATLTDVQKFTMIVSFIDESVVEVNPIATDGSKFVPGPEVTPRATPTGDGDQ